MTPLYLKFAKEVIADLQIDLCLWLKTLIIAVLEEKRPDERNVARLEIGAFI